MSQRDIDAKRHDEKGHVFLHGQEQYHHDHVRPPAALGHQVKSEESQRDLEAVRMEVLEVEPPKSRIQQEGEGGKQGQPGIAQRATR